jgi:hypothetical protein
MLYFERDKSVTVIQRLDGGRPVPLGTGFFISSEGGFYLVTCLHVMTRAGGPRSFLGNDEEVATRLEAVILKLRPKGGGGVREHRVELSDPSGRRRWRTYLRPESCWDVAVLEIERRELAAYDVRPWEEEELLPASASLTPGDEIFVLTYPREYGDAPASYDVHARMDVEEHQVFASDRGALTTQPLYQGASGSPVYRVIGEVPSGGKPERGTAIQLVGIVTGAFPLEDPRAGHIVYADTAAEIIRAREDCLDEKGTSFRR